MRWTVRFASFQACTIKLSYDDEVPVDYDQVMSNGLAGSPRDARVSASTAVGVASVRSL